MRSFAILALLLALLAGASTAQTVLYGPGSTRAFQTGYSGPDTIVRDSQANIYVIYRHAVVTSLTQWDLSIARSADNGKTWNMGWQTGFTAPLGSDFGNYHPCIAIDSQDNLHCAWYHRVAFTGSRLPATIHYNRFEATKQAWGTEWTVNPSPIFERPNPCLAVDSNDYVWFAHGNSGWGSLLQRSNMPFASDGKFTVFSPSPGIQQHTSLVIDKNDFVHVTWYDTAGYAGVKHSWIDPGASTPAWTKFSLSNHGATNISARAEYRSKMCADDLGNVYAIHTVDEQAGSTSRTSNTEFFVRKWDGATQAWGTPQLLHSVPIAVWHPGYATSVSNANSGAIIGCVCDESAGEVYCAYRDFTTGDLILARWDGDDLEAPTIFARLMNTAPTPAGTRNYFLYPRFRGTLWPRQNRTAWGLHLTYVAGDQTATTPVYTDYFESFPVGSLSSAGNPAKIGTTFKMTLTAAQDGGKGYIAALCVTGLGNSILLDRRYMPLLPDSIFYASASNVLPGVFQNFTNILGTTGSAQMAVALPNIPGLVGIKAYTGYVTFPGGPKGIQSISNPFAFTIQK